jgi:hypothetical protein
MRHWAWMKHLLTLLCLVGACACYALSFETGAAILFVAGAILEFTFWIRVGLGGRHNNAGASS